MAGETIYALPGATEELTASNLPTGLVAGNSIGVRILDDAGATLAPGRMATSITEFPAGGGHYVRPTIMPPAEGSYSVMWDIDPGGLASPANTVVYRLVVTSNPQQLVVPISSTLGPQPGPCSAWLTGADVLAICSAAGSVVAADLDQVAIEASEVLYEFSGRQFGGPCLATLRPCRTRGGCEVWAQPWGWSWGQGPALSWWGLGWGGEEAAPCGCQHLNEIMLPGYPIRSIEVVKIDGAVVPGNQYRIDDWRYLVRLDDGSVNPPVARAWPGCQNLALPDTASGTFSVTYTYGTSVPGIGKRAAAQLACQLYLADHNPANCLLPNRVTKVTRQGVTVERPSFVNWARMQDGRWSTGLVSVDTFLAAYNPRGLRRRPAVWSPDLPAMGRRQTWP